MRPPRLLGLVLLGCGILCSLATCSEIEEVPAGSVHETDGADSALLDAVERNQTVSTGSAAANGEAGAQSNATTRSAEGREEASVAVENLNQSSTTLAVDSNATGTNTSELGDGGDLVPQAAVVVDPVEVASLMPELMDSIPPSGECSDRCSRDTCNGHGVCRQPDCDCNCSTGYTGQFCQERVAVIFNFKLRPPPKPCPDNCAGQGICNHNGTCDCEKGWAGLNCSIECVGGAANPCSGHGTCNKTDGKCICAEGYEGKNCNRRTLPQNVEEYRKTLLGQTEKEEPKPDAPAELAAPNGDKQPSEPDAGKNASESTANITAASNHTEAKNGTEGSKVQWVQGREIPYDMLASYGVNHAAFDLGAKALGSNKEAKGEGALLKNDRDKYWISPCKVEKGKWIVIELNELVYVHTVVIGSFEYYSSTVNAFQVLGHVSYPTDTWTLLGHFQASPSRKLQEFKLKAKKLAKYIKIRLLSHHANEFYCTLSSVRVYGTTQWEEMGRMLDENEEVVEAAKRRLDGVEDEKKEEAEEVLAVKNESAGKNETAVHPTNKTQRNESAGAIHANKTKSTNETATTAAKSRNETAAAANGTTAANETAGAEPTEDARNAKHGTAEAGGAVWVDGKGGEQDSNGTAHVRTRGGEGGAGAAAVGEAEEGDAAPQCQQGQCEPSAGTGAAGGGGGMGDPAGRDGPGSEGGHGGSGAEVGGQGQDGRAGGGELWKVAERGGQGAERQEASSGRTERADRGSEPDEHAGKEEVVGEEARPEQDGGLAGAGGAESGASGGAEGAEEGRLLPKIPESIVNAIWPSRGANGKGSHVELSATQEASAVQGEAARGREEAVASAESGDEATANESAGKEASEGGQDKDAGGGEEGEGERGGVVACEGEGCAAGEVDAGEDRGGGAAESGDSEEAAQQSASQSGEDRAAEDANGAQSGEDGNEGAASEEGEAGERGQEEQQEGAASADGEEGRSQEAAEEERRREEEEEERRREEEEKARKAEEMRKAAQGFIPTPRGQAEMSFFQKIPAKIKDIEITQSLLQSYVQEIKKQYDESFEEVQTELAAVKALLESASNAAKSDLLNATSQLRLLTDKSAALQEQVSKQQQQIRADAEKLQALEQGLSWQRWWLHTETGLLILLLVLARRMGRSSPLEPLLAASARVSKALGLDVLLPASLQRQLEKLLPAHSRHAPLDEHRAPVTRRRSDGATSLLASSPTKPSHSRQLLRATSLAHSRPAGGLRHPPGGLERTSSSPDSPPSKPPLQGKHFSASMSDLQGKSRPRSEVPPRSVQGVRKARRKPSSPESEGGAEWDGDAVRRALTASAGPEPTSRRPNLTLTMPDIVESPKHHALALDGHGTHLEDGFAAFALPPSAKHSSPGLDVQSTQSVASMDLASSSGRPGAANGAHRAGKVSNGQQKNPWQKRSCSMDNLPSLARQGALHANGKPTEAPQSNPLPARSNGKGGPLVVKNGNQFDVLQSSSVLSRGHSGA